jgi:hypothetical protein
MSLLVYHAARGQDILQALCQDIYLCVARAVGSPNSCLHQLTQALAEQLYFPREGQVDLLPLAFAFVQQVCAI